MLETLRNAFKIKDIRKRIIFTFLMLVVIRIGSQLPDVYKRQVLRFGSTKAKYFLQRLIRKEELSNYVNAKESKT